MKIIKVDSKHFINLGDLDHLIRGLMWEINGKYDRDGEGNFWQKDGKFGLTHDDAVTKAAYAHVMTKVLSNLIHACDSPEEIRALHNSIESEFYWGKYVIILETGEKKAVFFSRFCEDAMRARLRQEGVDEMEIARMFEEDGKIGDPVFSEKARMANYYEDWETADSAAEYIRSNYGTDVKITPAWYYDDHAKKRLLDLIEGNGNG